MAIKKVNYNAHLSFSRQFQDELERSYLPVRRLNILSLNIRVPPSSTRISQPLSRKFALSSAWSFGGFYEHDGGVADGPATPVVVSPEVRMSRIIIAITDGHRAVYNAWRRIVYLPTCTCYLYAVKFISRLSATDHHGFYLRLSIPARVYMHLTPATNERREREKESD